MCFKLDGFKCILVWNKLIKIWLDYVVLKYFCDEIIYLPSKSAEDKILEY